MFPVTEMREELVEGVLCLDVLQVLPVLVGEVELFPVINFCVSFSLVSSSSEFSVSFSCSCSSSWLSSVTISSSSSTCVLG